MEALINGTPSSAIIANIQLHIDTFAPFINKVELPSLWTICRARTDVLVISQTLSAYRLAKVDKWGKLLTDATSRMEVTFQNLLHEHFKVTHQPFHYSTFFYIIRPLLLSSCIFLEDERSKTVCKSIVDTIREKASLLDQ